jgi:hypothetical protein
MLRIPINLPIQGHTPTREIPSHPVHPSPAQIQRGFACKIPKRDGEQRTGNTLRRCG